MNNNTAMEEPLTTALESAHGAGQRPKLEEQALEELRQIAERHTYAPGSELTRQGALENTFYVIESGQAAVLRREEDGPERLLDTMGPHQYFGELGLLDDQPRYATVRAVEEVTVLEVDADRFMALMRANPSLILNVTRTVLSSMRHLDQRTIATLRAKNQQLSEAYDELKEAQAQLVVKERLEHELNLAAEAQRRLLPAHLPQFEEFDFAAYLQPARTVGGDLYDVRALDDEHVGILVADVADKGMHAALMMAVSRTLFYQASRAELSPSAVAHAVHRGLLTLGGAEDAYGDTFVTAFYGVLHRPSRQLTYVRAAHDRPLLVHAGSQPTLLSGNGRFLGMIEELALTEYSVTLAPGDALVLYSDGLPDATNVQGQSYGLERLKTLVSTSAGVTSQALLEEIVDDVNRWTRDASLFDDLTVLVVKSRMT